MMSGDWVVAAVACLSSGAMVGGICFRNFAAPRLVGAMIGLSFGPSVVAALISGHPILLVVVLQVPLYLGCMTVAAIQLNRMMIRTMVAERENDSRARHDPLTGLLNRAGLTRAIAERTERAPGEPFALFYMDLDGFKPVNDMYGHHIGDELLRAVAERLQSVVREEDAIARIGGDEFVVLASGGDAKSAQELGNRMVEAVEQRPYKVTGDMIDIGISAGVAIYPQHGGDLGNLLAEADAALYQAKFWGRARCTIAGTPPPNKATAVTFYTPQPAQIDRHAA